MDALALMWEQEKQNLVRRRSFRHGVQYWMIWENYVAERNGAGRWIPDDMEVFDT